jgi:hypothetical protein
MECVGNGEEEEWEQLLYALKPKKRNIKWKMGKRRRRRREKKKYPGERRREVWIPILARAHAAAKLSSSLPTSSASSICRGRNGGEWEEREKKDRKKRKKNPHSVRAVSRPLVTSLECIFSHESSFFENGLLASQPKLAAAKTILFCFLAF